MSDDIIWVPNAPKLFPDGGDFEITFATKHHEHGFRMRKALARSMASDIIFLLDEEERKPSNVSPFKRK